MDNRRWKGREREGERKEKNISIKINKGKVVEHLNY